jgi:hypothetical protein
MLSLLREKLRSAKRQARAIAENDAISFALPDRTCTRTKNTASHITKAVLVKIKRRFDLSIFFLHRLDYCALDDVYNKSGKEESERINKEEQGVRNARIDKRKNR